MPERQLAGRVQVESPAQRPGFYEQPPLPEGLPNVGLRDPVDPQAELKLCGSLNLRVHAAEVVSDADEPIPGRPSEKR